MEADFQHEQKEMGKMLMTKKQRRIFSKVEHSQSRKKEMVDKLKQKKAKLAQEKKKPESKQQVKKVAKGIKKKWIFLYKFKININAQITPHKMEQGPRQFLCPWRTFHDVFCLLRLRRTDIRS